MEGISATGDQVNTEIAGHSVNHEGFVVSNQFGVYKLIKRQEFSFYNFTLPKQWWRFWNRTPEAPGDPEACNTVDVGER